MIYACIFWLGIATGWFWCEAKYRQRNDRIAKLERLLTKK